MSLKIRTQSAPVLAGLSVLLYGMPKVGKTTEAAKFPKPLLLNCEPAGTNFLSGVDVADIANLNDLKAQIEEIARADYQTIVIDGFSSMVNTAAVMSAGDQREPRRAYQAVTRDASIIVNNLLRSGKIVIATGHSRAVQVETMEPGQTRQKTEVRPDFNPALGNDIFGAFSMIFYCFPGNNGKSEMITKPRETGTQLIFAGDRSGKLPERMPLSAAELMRRLREFASAAKIAPAVEAPAGGQEQTEAPPTGK